MNNKSYRADTEYTLTNFEATILWLIVMVVGAIFHDRIYIWVVATIIWFNHITRHWEVGGNRNE